jgi:hypothetical protein
VFTDTEAARRREWAKQRAALNAHKLGAWSLDAGRWDIADCTACGARAVVDRTDERVYGRAINVKCPPGPWA